MCPENGAGCRSADTAASIIPARDLIYSAAIIGSSAFQYATEQRRNPPLLAASDTARGRPGRAEENLFLQRALHRRRRTRVAHCPVSGRRRRCEGNLPTDHGRDGDVHEQSDVARNAVAEGRGAGVARWRASRRSASSYSEGARQAASTCASSAGWCAWGLSMAGFLLPSANSMQRYCALWKPLELAR